MRGAVIFLLTSVCLLGGCGNSDKDQPWALPQFQYYDNGHFLSITGSLIGDDVGYKNNTWKIMCGSTRRDHNFDAIRL